MERKSKEIDTKIDKDFGGNKFTSIPNPLPTLPSSISNTNLKIDSLLIKMISVGEALDIVLKVSQRLPPVVVPLHHALGKVLAQDVTAPDPLPPYPASIKVYFSIFHPTWYFCLLVCFASIGLDWTGLDDLNYIGKIV